MRLPLLALSLAVGLSVSACGPSSPPGAASPPDGSTAADATSRDVTPAPDATSPLDAAGPDATPGCTPTEPCAPDQYCAGESCGTAGHCIARPPMCTSTPAAVCGCDGHTYANPCTAAMTGVRVAAMGACTTAPDAGPMGCTTDTDCGPTALCDAPACDSPGTCVPRPTGCATVYTPVCGCDGQTYANMCVARAAGVRVAARGMCGAPGSDGGTATDATPADVTAMDAGTPGGCLATGCATGSVCCAAPDAPAYGTCYDPRCLACCMPAVHADAGGAGPCTTNADCSPAAWCAGSACGAPGLCTPRPAVCTDIYDPVCGCDGSTYANACAAATAGVRVATTGACAVPDAGRPACLGVLCLMGSRCCTVPGAPRFGMCYPTTCTTCCVAP